ncbi:MAG: condensation domain-containing protein, partial [Planktothrix sp.]
FIDQFIPGQYFYNVPTALKLKGNLNLAALEQTLEQIVCRHETLRTNFKMIEGEVMQMILPNLTLPLTVINLEKFPTEQRENEAIKRLVTECERPFNLSSEPLLRVVLFRLNETQHILLINFHHIICDDWSIGLFIRELKTLYTAFVSSNPSISLPELPLQYADFSEWQRQWLEGEILEKQLRYWRKQLQDISKLNLPTDRGLPLFPSYQGSTQYLELSPDFMEALEQFSQREGATLFMTLIATFQTLLYRYTHQTDIVIGSPIANRNRSEIENLIGFFVNTLVLRTDFSDNPTFKEILGRVKEVTLGAYSHQDLPFEKLVEELKPERNLAQNPLFQVVFGYENSPMTALDLPDLTVSSLNYELKTTRFDLEFHLWKCSEGFRSLWGGDRWQYSQGIRGVVVYNTDLFDADTVNRMIEHFKILLNQIINNPNEKVDNLSILTQAEQDQLLQEWNSTKTDYPQDLCIHQIFEAKVKQYSDQIAVSFSGQHLTYQELNDCSNQLAHYLQKLGVNSEVIVGVCLEPSLEIIIAILGIIKAGGVYLPLDS